MAVAKLASRRQGKEETAMQYIAAVLREFDALHIYGEQERISIIQNGLTPKLRNLVIGKTWSSVQEMDLHLRTIEVAEELYKETGPKPANRTFFTRRSVQAIEQTGNVDTDCKTCEHCDETEESERESTETGTNGMCCAVRARQYTSKPNSTLKMANKPQDETNKDNENQRKRTNEVVDANTCFNCGSSEHRFRECNEPATRAFCFKCGKKDTITPKCDCSKNSKGVACLQTEASDEKNEE